MNTTGNPPLDLPRHPIAVVEQRTGLTQDVLRVWERRYAAVEPARSAGGQRRYSDADIERLRLLQAATRRGRTIGQVAGLSTTEIARLVEEDATSAPEQSIPSDAAPNGAADLVRQALLQTRTLDAPGLDATIRRGLAVLGVPAFLEFVATPLLRRIGDEWHDGRLTPAQEHLASAALNDLIGQTMRAVASDRSAPRLVVATPAGERHAIGAALIGAAAAADGWHVISLGTDLPAADIAGAAATTGATIVAVSLLYVDLAERMARELQALRAHLPPGIELIAGGPGALAAHDTLTAAGIRVGGSLADFREALLEVRAREAR